MRRPTAVLVILAVLFAGACASHASGDAPNPVNASGDTTADLTSDASSDPTADTVATTTKAATTPTTAAAAPAKPLTEAELQSRLVTTNDLPQGWSVDPSASNSNSNGDLPECLKAVEVPNDPRPTAEADFVRGEDFPTFSEELEAYADGEVAPELDRAIKTVDGCGPFQFTSDGVDFSGSITRNASFPTFGDQSAAWQMTFQAGGYSFHFAIVFVRQGNVGMTVFYGGVADGALELAKPFVQKAVAKL
jgi:hypothetical protein